MKKFVKINFFVLMAGLFALTLTSCLKTDEITYPPVKLEDVPGNYFGVMVTNQSDVNRQTNMDFTVNGEAIAFTDLPTNEIISSIFNDTTKAAEIQKNLGKVAYNLLYTGEIVESYNSVKMTLNPAPLELHIKDGDVVKTAIVKISSKDNAIYSGVENAMGMKFTVDEIVYDGATITPFSTITYTIPYAKNRN